MYNVLYDILFLIIKYIFPIILEKRLKVFLDTLLELNEAGANFSDDEIRDEVVTMMIGVSIEKITKCVQYYNYCIIIIQWITGQ